MMYRILIVDDEKIERTGIRFLLGQMNREFEIFEAVNGKDALEWLEQNRVDILLTDIKMPFMNGIELLEQVSVKYPEIKKLIFSGYGEFEYARQAMRFGVEEYILKPVDPAEFKNVMQKIVDGLDSEKKEENRKAAEVSFFKEYVLNAIVNGAGIEEVERRARDCYDLDFLNGYKRLMLLETDTDFFAGRQEILTEQIGEKLGMSFDYLNLNPQQSLLFFTEEKGDGKENARLVNEILEGELENGQKSYVAVSSGLKDGTQLGERCQELELLMENRFYDLECREYMAENEAERAEDVRLDDDTLMKQMKQDIRTKDILSLKEHCGRLFQNCSQNVGFSQIYVKFMFSSLLKFLCEAIPEKTEKELNVEIELLYHTQSLEGIRNIMEKNIGLLERQAAQNAPGGHREVEAVKRYIYGHYGEELSIEMLAEQVYMAPSYLSTVFKKETGQNLSKFIKACRMEKAREMLESTHEKIVGISEKVGYPNVSYFCQSFREYFGVSPQKYRDMGDTTEENEEDKTLA